MAEVKLLGSWISPFSCRIELALKIKGVEYEYIEENLQNKSTLLLQSNPVHKKIPVLIHNGKPIVESLVILEYIDETFEGPSILPKDPYDRAIARFWVKFIDDKLWPTMMKAMRSRGEGREECLQLMKVLDNELKDKKFFVGDKFGLADIVANCVAFWPGVFEEASEIVLVKSEDVPNFSAWRDEYLKLSHVQESLPPREKFIAHIQAMIQAASAAK